MDIEAARTRFNRFFWLGLLSFPLILLVQSSVYWLSPDFVAEQRASADVTTTNSIYFIFAVISFVVSFFVYKIVLSAWKKNMLNPVDQEKTDQAWRNPQGIAVSVGSMVGEPSIFGFVYFMLSGNFLWSLLFYLIVLLAIPLAWQSLNEFFEEIRPELEKLSQEQTAQGKEN